LTSGRQDKMFVLRTRRSH